MTLDAESKQLFDDIEKLKADGDTPENRELMAIKTARIKEIADRLSIPPRPKA